MDKKEIEYQIRELKEEYVRLQNDLEKLESVGGNVGPLERQITEIENELRTLNQKLREV
ncbi:MAG TPA: SE1832 family protein [Bacillus sp. (in: firmicutes)]|uniref:SE1832 family protein n=1 Tax=Bacillus litorisediminis TaxID=2922713 RepID=UPI001FAEF1F0|nr:SE1832 family protein [Bacillus litorisediminis]HWO74462.1 SE1832 family protein [Bacillus sp. (in: firmicutes)]